MNVNMDKEKKLAEAIGMLPEDMLAEEDTRQLKAGAKQLEKKEKRRKLLYAMLYPATAAACLVIIIISANAVKYFSHNKTINNSPGKEYSQITSGNNSTGNNSKNSCNKNGNADNDSAGNINENNPGDNNSNNNKNNDNQMPLEDKACVTGEDKASIFSVKYIKERPCNIFENCVSSSKKAGNNNSTSVQQNPDTLNKIPYGKTSRLQVVRYNQDKKRKYILFSIDTDFNLAINGKAGSSFAINNKNSRKHSIKKSRVFCKADSKIYLDVTNKNIISSDTGYSKTRNMDIPEWDKKGIQVIASASTADRGNSTFYIGRKDNKKGGVYYGIFIKEEN